MPETCRECHLPIDQPAPDRWTQKWPGMAGLCPACLFDWISKQPRGR